MTPRAYTISVAMCTYNGARYLPQQLASILRQTRQPDAMVIRDDGSTDATVALIEKFCRQAPFPVDFQINANNLGAKKNFELAVSACTGELIALSDQDDIWHRERLDRSEREFIDHPEVGLVFSDGEVIDDFDQATGSSLWKSFRLYRGSLEQLQSGENLPLARRTFVTGATVMFRARYAALCFPTGKEWWHDGWLAMLIASVATIRPIDEDLISYRSHAAQQLGLGIVKERRWKTLEERATKQAESMRQLHDSLVEVLEAVERLACSGEKVEASTVRAFSGYRDFLAMRLTLPERRLARVPVMLQAVEDYRRLAMGIVSMARDIILPKAGLPSDGESATIGHE